MYEKQSQKPNWSKNKLQNFLLKDINETSWTDNVQPNIKLNIKTNWEIPAVTTWQINTIDPKQADQVKNKMCMKSNLKKPNWSKNKLQNFLPKDINETSWIDNIQPNIKLNSNTNWEELHAKTT